MATWLSCKDAEVVSTLTGKLPSAQSMCVFQPIQLLAKALRTLDNHFNTGAVLFLQPAERVQPAERGLESVGIGL